MCYVSLVRSENGESHPGAIASTGPNGPSLCSANAASAFEGTTILLAMACKYHNIPCHRIALVKLAKLMVHVGSKGGHLTSTSWHRLGTVDWTIAIASHGSSETPSPTEVHKSHSVIGHVMGVMM
jgi:hypothetical protein